MAKLALSGLCSDASGKLGASIIYRHNGQLMERTYTKPANPQTSYQTNVRTNWGMLQHLWQTITEAQRFSWKFAASQIKLSNSIGTKFTPTAQQLFMKCNQNLFSCGLSSVPSFISPLPFCSLINPTAIFNSHHIFPPPHTDFNIIFPGQTSAANLTYLIFCTNALSTGISNGKKYLRFIGLLPASTSDSIDVLGMFSSRYGPAIGYTGKVFLKLIPIDNGSGFNGQVLNFSSIIQN